MTPLALPQFVFSAPSLDDIAAVCLLPRFGFFPPHLFPPILPLLMPSFLQTLPFPPTTHITICTRA